MQEADARASASCRSVREAARTSSLSPSACAPLPRASAVRDSFPCRPACRQRACSRGRAVASVALGAVATVWALRPAGALGLPWPREPAPVLAEATAAVPLAQAERLAASDPAWAALPIAVPVASEALVQRLVPVQPWVQLRVAASAAAAQLAPGQSSPADGAAPAVAERRVARAVPRFRADRLFHVAPECCTCAAGGVDCTGALPWFSVGLGAGGGARCSGFPRGSGGCATAAGGVPCTSGVACAGGVPFGGAATSAGGVACAGAGAGDGVFPTSDLPRGSIACARGAAGGG